MLRGMPPPTPTHPRQKKKYCWLDPILSYFDLIWFDVGLDMVNKFPYMVGIKNQNWDAPE